MWAGEWFRRLERLHAVFDENRKDSQPKVKVANLDA
jgi:hypothetical protein